LIAHTTKLNLVNILLFLYTIHFLNLIAFLSTVFELHCIKTSKQ